MNKKLVDARAYRSVYVPYNKTRNVRIPALIIGHRYALIIRLEARLQPNIGISARFGGVHAFGYNSAVSEPIWMKSGAL